MKSRAYSNAGPSRRRRPVARRAAAGAPRCGGFTLVEVLVALAVMAILAAMAFRGIDALAHARESALNATDRTLKLNSGMSQFEYDVSQALDTKVLPSAITFDGATLRMARRTSSGVQLVVWTLQDRRWQRWASAPVVRESLLTEAWLRSQQWSAISGAAVTVLENVDDFQVYLCNPNSTTDASSGCSWNNVQSTQGTTSTTTSTSTSTGTGTTATSGTTTGTATVTAQPTGIRITLKLPDGEIQRERELPHWGAVQT